MAIDSPLLRLLRQQELENLQDAERMRQQRLQINAEIAQIEAENRQIESETRQIEAETRLLEAEIATLLLKLCRHLALKTAKPKIPVEVEQLAAPASGR